MRKNHPPKKARFFTPTFKDSMHTKNTHKTPNNGRKRCPMDGKLINNDLDEAIHYALKLSRWNDGAPVRVYDCEHGFGCHLTTKPQYVTRTSPQRTLPTDRTVTQPTERIKTAADKPCPITPDKPTISAKPSSIPAFLKNWRNTHETDKPDDPFPTAPDDPTHVLHALDGSHPFAIFRATMPSPTPLLRTTPTNTFHELTDQSGT